MTNYKEQAENFCKEFGVTVDIKFLKTDFHFEGDKEKRDIYEVTITRSNKSYTFKFGDSIVNTEKNKSKLSGQLIQKVKPSAYDILACVQKYDVGDFDDFISEFGYTFDTEREYIKIKKLYFDVKDEYKNIYNLFSDCMDELAEIQ